MKFVWNEIIQSIQKYVLIKRKVSCYFMSHEKRRCYIANTNFKPEKLTINKTIYSVALVVSLLINLISCEILAQEPQNISLLKKELVKYYDSGDYEADIVKVVDKAKQHLELHIKKNISNKNKLALVLDVDETVLSSYSFRAKHDFVFPSEKTFDQAASKGFPPIKPVAKLYNYAKAQNIALFFITGRRDTIMSQTLNNLKNAGYLNWNGLFLKPKDLSLKTADFKAWARKEIVNQGYTIVASIGDQPGDFYEGCNDCNFKLPNPFYISS